MGISFKVSKTGTRFRPKPAHLEISADGDSAAENSKENSQVLPRNESSGVKRKLETDINNEGDNSGGFSGSSTFAGGHLVSPEHEVSFTLNVFPNGFTIGKPTEKGKIQPLLQDVLKSFHPYDRTCETLFSASS